MIPFLRADEELWCYKELVEMFEIDLMNIAFIIFQVQYYGAHPLGFNYTPDAFDLCVLPWVLEVCTIYYV